jgi:transposase
MATWCAACPAWDTTLASELLAEISSIDRFPSRNVLAAASGLAPVLQKSGKTLWGSNT